VRYFYSLSLYLLLPGVLLRLWWKGRRVPGYRHHWRERLGWCGVRSKTPVIWVHAVSVGEVRAAQPLLQALPQRYPGVPIVLSTTTPTGRATARQLFGDALGHCYLPYDLPGAVRRFLDRVNPVVAVIMETEIWPNLYHALQRREVPLLLFNARLSETSFNGYLRLPGLSKPAVRAIRHIAVQSETDAQRFTRLGARQAQLSVAGNLKFDVQLPDDFSARVAGLRQCLGSARPVWVAGSTHAGEDAVVLSAHQGIVPSHADALLVIAPRHPERARDVVERCEKTGLACRLLSDISPAPAGAASSRDYRGWKPLLLYRVVPAQRDFRLLAATHGAVRVACQFDAAPFVVQGIEDQQPAAQWLADIQQYLDGFQRLQAADGADHGCQYAVVGAGLVGFFAFPVQAAVAGAVAAFRDENRELAFQADRRAGYQRRAVLYAGGIDGEAGGEIVAGVEYQVSLFDLLFQPVGIEAGVQRRHADIRVQFTQGVTRGFNLGPAEVAFPVQDLALQVGQFHRVVVGNDNMPDAGAGQVHGGRGTQAAGTDDQDTRVEQRLLSGGIDLRQQYLAAVAEQLLVIHGG